MIIFILKICLLRKYIAIYMLMCVCVCVCVCVIHSVMSNSLQVYGLQPSRLLCPWDSLGKNTGVGCHSLLQGIFLTQGQNLGLSHCWQILYGLSHHGSPYMLISVHIYQHLCMINPQGEKTATYSSILVWKIPWTGKPHGLQSKGSQRVGQD